MYIISPINHITKLLDYYRLNNEYRQATFDGSHYLRTLRHLWRIVAYHLQNIDYLRSVNYKNMYRMH